MKTLFNDELQQALVHDRGACVFEGSTGSGKSTLIRERAARLIESGVIPQSILILCANEYCVKETQRLFNYEHPELKAPLITTLDRLCAKLVLGYEKQNGIKSARIYKRMDRFVKKICKDAFGVHLSSERLAKLIDKLIECDAMMLPESEINGKMFDQIDLAYLVKALKKLKKNNEIRDLMDVRSLSLQLLTSKAYSLEACDLRLTHLMLDDAENLSFLDHFLIKQLAADLQSIFFAINRDNTFRFAQGAFPQAYDAFNTTYDNPLWIKAAVDYHTPATIAECMSRLVKKPLNSGNEAADVVAFKALRDKELMMDYLLKNISAEKETALIYRHSSTALLLIDRLLEMAVPFQLHDSMALMLENDTAHELLSIMRLFMNAHDLDAFMDVYEQLDFGLTANQAKQVREIMLVNPQLDVYQAMLECNMRNAQKQKIISSLEAIRMAKDMNAYRLLEFIHEESGYAAYLKRNGLAADIHFYSTMLLLAKRYPKADMLLARLDELKKIHPNASAPLILTSAENAFGQSFDDVYLLDCINTSFPLVGKAHPDYPQEISLFAYLMSRAGNHLELIAYKAAAQVKVRMSDFMYTLCSKEAESEVAEETNKPAARLRRGAKIQHKLFGEGIISNLSEGKITVRFEMESKTLSLSHCIENNMIELIN